MTRVGEEQRSLAELERLLAEADTVIAMENATVTRWRTLTAEQLRSLEKWEHEAIGRHDRRLMARVSDFYREKSPEERGPSDGNDPHRL